MNYKQDTYRRLGDYIQQIDDRNIDLSVTTLLGLSMTKEFRPSTSNVVGTDLSKYKIVREGKFAFDTMSVIRVHKVPICYNNLGYPIIISPAYITFEIKDERILNPLYLKLLTNRSEFDRYADFKSDAAVRGGYNWDELCDTYIPIPSPEEQQRIVNDYYAIYNRIETNKQTIVKLEEAAYALYRKMFVEDINTEDLPDGWKFGKLEELADISSGTSCKHKSNIKDNTYRYPVAGAAGIIGYSSDFSNEKRLLTTGRVGTLGVTCRYNEKVWYADNVLVIAPYSFEYIYQILNNLDFNILIKFGVQSLITQSGLKEYPILIPPSTKLNEFEEKATALFNHIDVLKKENFVLNDLLDNILNNF